MDKFTRMMLEQTGLISMIGKSERGPVAIEAIKDNKSAYLMAVGGAAYLVAKAIKSAKVVGFADLGMEAIYEFEVKDMPVTVAVDSNGTSVAPPARGNGRRRSADPGRGCLRHSLHRQPGASRFLRLPNTLAQRGPIGLPSPEPGARPAAEVSSLSAMPDAPSSRARASRTTGVVRQQRRTAPRGARWRCSCARHRCVRVAARA